MFKLMQGASVLALATAIVLGPVAAAAQTATGDAAGTDIQTETGTETAQDTVIPPVEGGTETAQETLPPAVGETDTDTAQTEPIAPATGTDPLASEADTGTETAEVEDGGILAPVQGTIQMQDENTVLASDLMGARIHNSADETVGSIDDVIISTDGTVEGVVIGVGGFLGIGKKQVAVEMSQISVESDAQGNPRLFLDSTRDALHAAPEFVTVAEQVRLQEIEAVQPTQGTTATEGGLGTGAAPPATD